MKYFLFYSFGLQSIKEIRTLEQYFQKKINK